MNGTIYAKIKEETVATNITWVMYLDKTPEVEDNHQDVLVLNLDNYDKRVALYLGPKISACNMQCFATQITNIFVCPHVQLPQNMPSNDKVILELSSQAFLHLQIHTDKSLAHQLYMACRHREEASKCHFVTLAH